MLSEEEKRAIDFLKGVCTDDCVNKEFVVKPILYLIENQQNKIQALEKQHDYDMQMIDEVKGNAVKWANELEQEKNKINYEINNCTTDLDTLIALDKRAIRDLENNTHEIKQHEVLTIIREFIRLRNDYEQEKEKNKDLQKQLNGAFDRGFINKDKLKSFFQDKITYRQFELQQEYKDFKDDIKLNTLQNLKEEILEENNE